MNSAPTTCRGVVYPWCCDHMGHMNVMHYVGRFDEAMWNLAAVIGLTPSYLRERGLMAAAEQRIAYRRELRAGDVFSIESAILAVGDRSLRIIHWMRNAGRELAAVCVLTGVHLDIATRRPRPLPDDVSSAARLALLSDAERWAAWPLPKALLE